MTLAGLASVAIAQATEGQSASKGSVSGLPIPRFVSLKSDEVNLRAGPGKDYPTQWVFRRAGLPVEVLQEFESWRQVRDADGVMGWVNQATATALVEAGVIANLQSCDSRWCYVTVETFRGYIEQSKLWGIYPGEIIK